MGAVSLEWVANSGVLVRWGALRLLVDGIYGENRYFSPPRREIQKAVFGMESAYRDVDALLFTHRHTDHFDAAHTDAYAENNAVRGIYVPRAGEDPDSYLEDRRPLPKAAARGVLRDFHLEMGERYDASLGPDCTASFLRCRHPDGATYRAVEHCALLLEVGGRRILFAADADKCAENGQLFTSLGRLDAVLITPLFFSFPSGRRILEAMGPEHVVIYHLPLAPDDVSGLRPLAERELREHGGPALSALMEPGDGLVLPDGEGAEP